MPATGVRPWVIGVHVPAVPAVGVSVCQCLIAVPSWTR